MKCQVISRVRRVSRTCAEWRGRGRHLGNEYCVIVHQYHSTNNKSSIIGKTPEDIYDHGILTKEWPKLISYMKGNLGDYLYNVIGE
jgi:hypothetical protein